MKEKLIEGWQAAAEFLGEGIKAPTLRAYHSRGYGPDPVRREVRGRNVVAIFTSEGLATWKAGRGGRGRRTDLKR